MLLGYLFSSNCTYKYIRQPSIDSNVFVDILPTTRLRLNNIIINYRLLTNGGVRWDKRNAIEELRSLMACRFGLELPELNRLSHRLDAEFLGLGQ